MKPISLYIKGFSGVGISDGNGINFTVFRTYGGDLRVRNNETGAVFDAIPVPPHGDLIDKDATMNAILEERGEDTACWFAGIVNDMPAIVPSDKAEEGET